MAHRFFTILVIPEKSAKIKRVVVPGWIVKGGIIGAVFIGALSFIMALDYWYVMNQITENKQLKIENRRLRQQVQIFKNRMDSIQETVDRVENFATRLKIITNIEDKDSLVQRINQSLPDAQTNVIFKTPSQRDQEGDGAKNDSLIAEEPLHHKDPEAIALRRSQEQLEKSITTVARNSLMTEQKLQDLYELLIDQKAFLAALPTRKPAIGYFTSGFGVRRSPYGERVKMHEGLDIANRPGTAILATANGHVTFAAAKPGYGRTVIVDHGYGLETWYAHANNILVKKGDKIRRGDKIALMGSSGRSTGSHVHYEVRVHGIPIDPLSYILEN